MFKKVRAYLINGQLQEAISTIISVSEANKFNSLLKDAILISGQICRINKDFLLGLMSLDDKEIRMNKLTSATFTLGEDVKQELKKNPLIKRLSF